MSKILSNFEGWTKVKLLIKKSVLCIVGCFAIYNVGPQDKV